MGAQFFAVYCFIGGLIYNAKHLKPRVELGSTMSIVLQLEKEEQRDLTCGINGKQPVPDEHPTIARSIAVQWRKNNATMLIFLISSFRRHERFLATTASRTSTYLA